MDKQIAVIGAGTMGNGIAHVFALSDYAVYLFDSNASQLEKAIGTISKNLERQVKKGLLNEDQRNAALSNIKLAQSLEQAVQYAVLVIEAATEKESIKLNIFRDIDRFASADAILTSNTSSISITRIAAVTTRPERVIGMHFMNPVPVMKLVEIINGFNTSKAVTEETVRIAKSLGKEPYVAADFPGFISNRILMPMINEAIICLQESVGSVESIDKIMRLGMSHPMGPLQLADFIGLDVCLHIMRVLQEGFGNPKYAPATLLVNMVAAGDLGVKTGQGFYTYEAGRKELLVSQRFLNS
jgi:3-hydroxybutyryl-CoA dehydrogenase